MAKRMEYALECIVWYNGHEEWLAELADELEKSEGLYPNPFRARDWHTEEHTIWMLLVGMFGDWGTSIRGGWIEQTKECAEFIRDLCAKSRDECHEEEGDD